MLFTAVYLQCREQCLQELAYKYLGGLKVEMWLPQWLSWYRTYLPIQETQEMQV